MPQTVLERPAPAQTETSAPAATARDLTALDRCDAAALVWDDGAQRLGRCGAQAFIQVLLPSGGELLFCGHHLGEQTVGRDASGTRSAVFAQRRAALEKAGAKFNSFYDRINLRPTDPNSGGL